MSSYREQYLQDYWPPQPNNPDMWQDNLNLLQAYFLAAEHILKNEGRPIDTLDISTGPCLAPLMATSNCIDRVWLSDYDEGNRKYLVESDIGYWRRYAEEIRAMFPNAAPSADELLRRANVLRHQNPVVDIDLRRVPIFLPNVIGRASTSLVTMHFVVDSICQTSEECFRLLEEVVEFVRPGGWLLISVLIESHGWELGGRMQPSPNLKESQFDEFFKQKGLDVDLRTRSQGKPRQIYDGRWTVFLTKKPNC